MRYLLCILLLIWSVSAVIAAPSNITGLAATGGVNNIALSWSAVSGATGYKIYRSEDGINYSLLTTQPSTSMTDKRYSASWQTHWTWETNLGLERNKLYYYKVTAYDSGGESAGAATSATTLIDSAYSGSIRLKMPVYLIAVATDHATSSNPTKAQIQILHDWARSNLSTKITLCVSKQILFATSGEPLNIRNYLQTLVSAYGYDIVTLPHNAWYPDNPVWSAGISAEIANIQNCHNQCITIFGKAPVSSYGWHYNKDLQAAAAALGYKIVAGGIGEVIGTDGYSGQGIPYQFYKPSKKYSIVPGDGNPANTLDAVAGANLFQMGTHYPATGSFETGGTGAKNDTTGFGLRDLFGDLFAQQSEMKDVIENSNFDFRGYIYAPAYLDPYWLFVDSTWSTGETTNGIRDGWYMWQQLALWVKDRYANNIDFVSASELATFAYATATAVNPCPVYAHESANRYNWSGGTPFQKQLRYESKNYHALIRWQTGVGNYLKVIQEVPYNTSMTEPAGLNAAWGVFNGVRRTAGTPARKYTFVAGGVTYDLDSGANVTIHPPSVSTVGTTVKYAWDIYNSGNNIKYLTLQLTAAESGMTATYIYADPSVTSVTEVNNVTSTTQPLAFESVAYVIARSAATMRATFR